MKSLPRRILKRLPWLGLLLAAAGAGANTLLEYAPVLSVTPVVQPVAVQRQVCSVDGHCGLLTFHETRTTGYSVVYLYEGREHTVQLPHDPGPTLTCRLTPAAWANPARCRRQSSSPRRSTYPRLW